MTAGWFALIEWWSNFGIFCWSISLRWRIRIMNIVPVHGYAAFHFVDESALLLSDLHYGVEAEMLRSGVWVPNRSTSRTEKVLKLI